MLFSLGLYHRHIEGVPDIKKSYQWLEKDGLKDNTVALIIAAQEQARSASSVTEGFCRQDLRCRLCKDAIETVQHIVERCRCKLGQYALKGKPSTWDSVQEHLCRAEDHKHELAGQKSYEGENISQIQLLNMFYFKNKH